jgi:hypothetical protein
MTKLIILTSFVLSACTSVVRSNSTVNSIHSSGNGTSNVEFSESKTREYVFEFVGQMNGVDFSSINSIKSKMDESEFFTNGSILLPDVYSKGQDNYVIAYKNHVIGNKETFVPLSFVLILHLKDGSIISDKSYVAEFGDIINNVWKVTSLAKTEKGEFNIKAEALTSLSPSTISLVAKLDGNTEFNKSNYLNSYASIKNSAH